MKVAALHSATFDESDFEKHCYDTKEGCIDYLMYLLI